MHLLLLILGLGFGVFVIQADYFSGYDNKQLGNGYKIKYLKDKIKDRYDNLYDIKEDIHSRVYGIKEHLYTIENRLSRYGKMGHRKKEKNTKTSGYGNTEYKTFYGYDTDYKKKKSDRYGNLEYNTSSYVGVYKKKKSNRYGNSEYKPISYDNEYKKKKSNSYLYGSSDYKPRSYDYVNNKKKSKSYDTLEYKSSNYDNEYKKKKSNRYGNSEYKSTSYDSSYKKEKSNDYGNSEYKASTYFSDYQKKKSTRYGSYSNSYNDYRKKTTDDGYKRSSMQATDSRSDSEDQEQECTNTDPCDADGSSFIIEDSSKKQRSTRTFPFQNFRHGAVVTPYPTCNQVGVDILVAGGSVVDAAIATLTCVGTVIPSTTGVCGGGFATVYARPIRKGREGPREVKTIIFRESAPVAVTPDFYVNSTASSVIGGTSVGVCGEIAGFYLAWQRYGKLPWAELYKPSIRLAKQGFPMDKRAFRQLRDGREQWDFPDNPDTFFLRDFVLDDDGNIKPAGTTLFRPLYARTLERIAEDPDSFYTGDLAEDMIDEIQDTGGVMTLEDLAAYRARLKDPLSSSLSARGQDLTLYNVEPPSGGAVIRFLMNMLDEFKFGESDLDTVQQRAETYHKIIECMKFGFGRRTGLGDGDFVPEAAELALNMTNREYVKDFFDLITLDQTQEVPFHQPLLGANMEDTGTAHVSIYAPDGTAISVTTSIGFLFGSKVRGRKTGIFYNDEMDDFSTPGVVNVLGFPPSATNFIEPGKMSQSSLAPSIILNSDTREVVLVIGGTSGGRQITAMTWVAAHTLWLGKSIAESVNLKRLHHQLIPNQFLYEEGFEQGVLDILNKTKGHNIQLFPTGAFEFNTMSTIWNNCPFECGKSCSGIHCIQAATDPRIPDSGSDGY